MAIALHRLKSAATADRLKPVSDTERSLWDNNDGAVRERSHAQSHALLPRSDRAVDRRTGEVRFDAGSYYLSPLRGYVPFKPGKAVPPLSMIASPFQRACGLWGSPLKRAGADRSRWGPLTGPEGPA